MTHFIRSAVLGAYLALAGMGCMEEQKTLPLVDKKGVPTAGHAESLDEPVNSTFELIGPENESRDNMAYQFLMIEENAGIEVPQESYRALDTIIANARHRIRDLDDLAELKKELRTGFDNLDEQILAYQNNIRNAQVRNETRRQRVAQFIEIGGEENRYGEMISILNTAIDQREEDIINLKEQMKATISFYFIDRILEEMGFEYQKNGTFSNELASRKIDCLGLSVIYASVGESLNLPIRVVNAPNHAFVRWDPDGDYIPLEGNDIGGKTKNWETTTGTESMDDSYLTQRVLGHEIKIDRTRLGNTNYLRSLTKDETLSMGYASTALVLMGRMEDKYFNQSLELLNTAIALSPRDPTPYLSRSLVHGFLGDRESSAADRAYHDSINHW